MTLLSLVLLPSLGVAATVPTSVQTGDPDKPWKDGLYAELVALNSATNFDFGAAVLPIDPPWVAHGWPTSLNFGTTAYDDYLQSWLMETYAVPFVDYLWAPPEMFTLDYVESITNYPSHNVPSTSLVQTQTDEELSGYAFLYRWNYGNNAYFGQKETLNRATAWLALELIALDHAHKIYNNTVTANHATGWTPIPASAYVCSNQPPSSSATYGNSMNTSYDFALALEDLAYSYWMIRDDLSPTAQAWFDEAYVRLGDRLACWGPQVLHYNRSAPGTVALLLIADATGDPGAWSDYNTYTKTFLSAFDQGGFFPDDNGWDSSYNNITIGHLGRLALLDDLLGPSGLNGTIHATIEQMYETKGLLTVSEPYWQPGNHRYAPNHWNSRTGSDTITGQGLNAVSPFEGIQLGIPEAYAELRDWDPSQPVEFAWNAPPTRVGTALAGDYRATQTFQYFDPTKSQYWDPSVAVYALARPWQEKPGNYYWPNYSLTLWDPKVDYLGDWAADVAANPGLTTFPSEETTDTCEKVDDDFVFVRSSGMTAMVHVGAVSNWEQGAAPAGFEDVGLLPAGFGGGMLSYLYDNDGGGTLLSRRRTRYGQLGSIAEDVELADDWSRWDSWSLHNVWVHRSWATGESVTQSARVVQPMVKVNGCNAGVGGASIAVSGDIPHQNTQAVCTPGHVSCVDFSAPIPYQRNFKITSGTVAVDTRVGPTVDVVDEVVETIPLHGLSAIHYGLPRGWTPGQPDWESGLIVTYMTSVGAVSGNANVGTWVDGVTEVTYARLQRGLRIKFTQPQRVKLNDWYGHWQSFDPSSPKDGGPDSYTAFRSHNLVIDLMAAAFGPAYGPQVLPATSVGYAITLL